jgi:low affinity Fe/Cu permease
MRNSVNNSGVLARFASWAAAAAGSTPAFIIAVAVVLLWIATGPLFHYSDTWQLVINTGTTIVTFLMVFLIQRVQNRDSLAVQLKLNELVAAMKSASNSLISVEDLSEEELELLHAHYRKLAQLAREKNKVKDSHSMEEAVSRHADKIRK